MSATNKTSNIELPLFIGTDTPSWLGDWNGAMTTIDSQIATAKSDAKGAAATAAAASESAAQTAQGLISTNNTVSVLQQTVGGLQSASVTQLYTNSQKFSNVSSSQQLWSYTPTEDDILIMLNVYLSVSSVSDGRSITATYGRGSSENLAVGGVPASPQNNAATCTFTILLPVNTSNPLIVKASCSTSSNLYGVIKIVKLAKLS